MRKVVILLIAILGIGATYQYQPPITQTLRAALPLPETDNSNLIILHLNVGQGDATLILGPETDGRRISVLIDAGDIPNSGDPDGGAIILKVLQDYNIAQLDYFIASHYDADHIGGLIAGRPSLHGTGFIFGPNGVPGALGDDDHDGKSDWLDTKMTLPDPEELGTDDDIQILHFIDRGQKDEPDTITYAKYEAIVAAHDKRTSIDTQEEVNSYSIDLQGDAKMTLYAADGYVRNREKPIPYVNTENERSLCFLISYGGFHYLIGGDTIGRKAGSENAKVELAIAQALRADLVNIVICAVILITQLLLWRKVGAISSGQQSNVVQEQLRMSREETGKSFIGLREEVGNAIAQGNKSLSGTLGEMGKVQLNQLSTIQTHIKEHTESNRAQIEKLHGAVGEQIKELRAGNEKKLEDIQGHIKSLTESNQEQIDKLQKSVASQLKELQSSNEKKLDQMRETVDEKLQSTLEKRLGESFKLVSERLEAVQRGLGEMKELAQGVGDLQRVLTNVKARGTWGEVQLGAILEQLLTNEQYDSNVKTKSDSNNLVEFAIRLPGADDDPNTCVYLPIDSKFPQEDYLRLMDASEKADVDAVSESTKALVRTVKSSAKDISEKYIDPPNTTDFAIMFLPTEGLYAEVLRQPGLMEDLQSQHRIIITGPTTLSATVNSLRLGFRTLAIEKRSAEVWQVLSAVKTEFKSFGTIMDKVKRQLSTVTKTIDGTQVRTRAMERKLKDVETLPEEEAASMLGLDEIDEISDEEGDIES